MSCNFIPITALSIAFSLKFLFITVQSVKSSILHSYLSEVLSYSVITSHLIPLYTQLTHFDIPPNYVPALSLEINLNVDLERLIFQLHLQVYKLRKGSRLPATSYFELRPQN